MSDIVFNPTIDGSIFVGTNSRDVAFGTNLNDQFIGLGGNDILRGLNGMDLLQGDGGADRLIGDGGDDFLDGGADNDLLFGGADNDIIFGGSGDDRVIGGSGDDLLDGGLGNDIIEFENPGAALSGDVDTVVFRRGDGFDTVIGFEDGIDLIQLKGTLTFDDLAFTLSGADTIMTDTATGQDLARFVGVDISAFDSSDFLVEVPVFTSSSTAMVAENSTGVVLDVTAIDDCDVEGLGLTYSFSTVGGGGIDNSLFNLDANTGEISFIAPPDFEVPGDADMNNEYIVQVTATDSDFLSTIQNITVAVTDVVENIAPTITSNGGGDTAAVNVAENTTTVTDVQTSDDLDVEGAGLTYGFTTNNGGGADNVSFSLDSTTGELAFIAPPDFETPGSADGDNEYLVQVTVTDSGGLTDTQDLTIDVTDVVENIAPTITSNGGGATAAVNVAENTTTVTDVQTSDDLDVEGAGLTYGFTTNNGGGADNVSFSLDSTTGELAFIAPPDFETPGSADGDNEYLVQVTVTDSGGLTDTQDLTIDVTDVVENTAPTITSSATASVAENQTSAIDIQSTDDLDSEGSGLTYSLTGGADQSLFSIDTNTGVVTFNAAPDFEAPGDANGDNDYEFQVTVTDSGALTDVQDITISVTDVVEVVPPDAVDDAFNVTGNVGINVTSTGSILNNDMGGAPTALFFGNSSGTASGTAANGSNTIATTNGGTVLLNADGTFTYDPAVGFEGTDSFFYFSSNAGGGDTAEVSFTVSDLIWFIDDSAGGTSDGTLANPFTSLADFNAVNNGTGNNPGAGDNIFLASGTYSGNTTLLNNQTLIGEGETGTLDGLLGITLPTFSNSLPTLGGANPVVNGDIALASGNTVRGFTLNGGISGTNVGTLSVRDMTINSGGVEGIDIDAVSGSNVADIEIVDSLFTGEAIRVESIGSARYDLDVINNTFTDVTDDIRAIVGGSGGVHDINYIGNTSTNSNNNSGGDFVIQMVNNADVTFDIQGNTILQSSGAISGSPIQVIGNGDAEGRIGGSNASDGNIIAGAGGDGIFIDVGGTPTVNAGNRTYTFLIQNNQIGVASGGSSGIGDEGIQVLSQDHSGTMNLTVEDNTIANTGEEGFRFLTDNQAGGTGPTNFVRVANNTFNNIPDSDETISIGTFENPTLNLDIQGNDGNSLNGSPGTDLDEIEIDESSAATVNIEQTSAANLSSVNNGASVDIDDPVTFNVPITPTLPSNA